MGGTNPSLLEAMGSGNIILARRNPFNMEVASDTAIYWSSTSELIEKMNYVITHYDAAKSLGDLAQKRASQYFNWDHLAELHDQYFKRLLKKGLPPAYS